VYLSSGIKLNFQFACLETTLSSSGKKDKNHGYHVAFKNDFEIYGENGRGRV